MSNLKEIFEKKFADIDQQIEEYDRWWRQQLIIILVKGIALIVFASLLLWWIL